MIISSFPYKSNTEDHLITVTYNYHFGNSWQECGVSKADGLLSALGFQTVREVAAFCASQNVLNAFSTKEFVSQFDKPEDKQALINLGKASKPLKIATGAFIFSSPRFVYEETGRPSYEDLFRFLFTWLTHGNDPS